MYHSKRSTALAPKHALLFLSIFLACNAPAFSSSETEGVGTSSAKPREQSVDKMEFGPLLLLAAKDSNGKLPRIEWANGKSSVAIFATSSVAGISINFFEYLNFADHPIKIHVPNDTKHVVLYGDKGGPSTITNVPLISVEGGSSDLTFTIANPYGVECNNAVITAHRVELRAQPLIAKKASQDESLFGEAVDDLGIIIRGEGLKTTQDLFLFGRKAQLEAPLWVGGDCTIETCADNMSAFVQTLNGKMSIGGKLGVRAYPRIDMQGPAIAREVELHSSNIFLKHSLTSLQLAKFIASNLVQVQGSVTSPLIDVVANWFNVVPSPDSRGLWAAHVNQDGKNIACRSDVAMNIQTKQSQVSGRLVSAGNLNLQTISHKSSGHMQACNATIAASEFSNILGGHVQVADLLRFEGENGGYMQKFINHDGVITCGGDMRIKATNLDNIRSVTLERIELNDILKIKCARSTISRRGKRLLEQSYIGGPSPRWYADDQRYLATITADKTRMSHPESLIGASGNIILDVVAVMNRCGQIHAGGDLNSTTGTHCKIFNSPIAKRATLVLVPQGDDIVPTEIHEAFQNTKHHEATLSVDGARLTQSFTPPNCNFENYLSGRNNEINCGQFNEIFDLAPSTLTAGRSTNIKGNTIEDIVQILDDEGKLQYIKSKSQIYTKDDVAPTEQVVFLDEYYDALARLYGFQTQQNLGRAVPGLPQYLRMSNKPEFENAVTASWAALQKAQRASLNPLGTVTLEAEPQIEYHAIQMALGQRLGLHRFSVEELFQNTFAWAVENGWVLGEMPSLEQLKEIPDNTPLIWWVRARLKDTAEYIATVVVLDRKSAAEAKTGIKATIAAKKFLNLEFKKISSQGVLESSEGEIRVHNQESLEIKGGKYKAAHDVEFNSKTGELKVTSHEHVDERQFLSDHDGETRNRKYRQTLVDGTNIEAGGKFKTSSEKNTLIEAIDVSASELDMKAGSSDQKGNIHVKHATEKVDEEATFDKTCWFCNWNLWTSRSDRITTSEENTEKSHFNIKGRANVNANGKVVTEAVDFEAGSFDIFGKDGVHDLAAHERHSRDSSKETSQFGFGASLSLEEQSISLGYGKQRRKTDGEETEPVTSRFAAREGDGTISSDVEANVEAPTLSKVSVKAPKINLGKAEHVEVKKEDFSDMWAGIKVGLQNNFARIAQRGAQLAAGAYNRTEHAVNAAFSVVSGVVETIAAVANPGRAGVWASARATAESKDEKVSRSKCATLESHGNSIEADELYTECLHAYGTDFMIKAKTWKNKPGTHFTESKSNELHGEADVMLYGVGGPLSLGAGGSSQTSESLVHESSTFTFSGKLTIDIEEKAELDGVQIYAKNIEATFGDLLLRSMQDTASASGGHADISLSPSMIEQASKLVAGASLGGNIRTGKWVNQLSFLIGTERAKIVVKGMLNLSGSLIANAERDANGRLTDKGKLELAARRLVYEDLKDVDNGLTLGVGFQQGSKAVPYTFSAEFGFVKKDQTTRSTVGQGNVKIEENPDELDKINRDAGASVEKGNDIEIETLRIVIPIIDFAGTTEIFSTRWNQIKEAGNQLKDFFAKPATSLKQQKEAVKQVRETYQPLQDAAKEKVEDANFEVDEEIKEAARIGEESLKAAQTADEEAELIRIESEKTDSTEKRITLEKLRFAKQKTAEKLREEAARGLNADTVEKANAFFSVQFQEANDYLDRVEGMGSLEAEEFAKAFRWEMGKAQDAGDQAKVSMLTRVAYEGGTFAFGFLPVVGGFPDIGEAIAGKSMIGDELSVGDRAGKTILGVMGALPGTGPTVKAAWKEVKYVGLGVKWVGKKTWRAVSEFWDGMRSKFFGKNMLGAFETASAGGKHSGWLQKYLNKPAKEIEKGIKSLRKQIAEHEQKIAEPEKFYPEWKTFDVRHQQDLITRKWPNDIARHRELIDILQGILKQGK